MKIENIDENVIVENEVAPFIKDNKVLQAVVLIIEKNIKNVISYYKSLFIMFF